MNTIFKKDLSQEKGMVSEYFFKLHIPGFKIRLTRGGGGVEIEGHNM